MSATQKTVPQTREPGMSRRVFTRKRWDAWHTSRNERDAQTEELARGIAEMRALLNPSRRFG